MLVKTNNGAPSALVNLTYLTEQARRDIVKNIVSPVTYQIGRTQKEMIVVKDLSVAIFINEYIGGSVLVPKDICNADAFVPDLVEKLYVILPSSITDEIFKNFRDFGKEAASRGISVRVFMLDEVEFSMPEFFSNPDYLPEFLNSVKDGEHGRGIECNS